MSVHHGQRKITTFTSDPHLTTNSLEEHAFSNNLEDYEINKNSPIGYGASAIVYGAIYKPLNKTVAVKMIDLDYFERDQIDEVRRETQLMSLSKHPNILRVYGSFVNASKLFIVTPYMSAGSCSDIMKTAHPDGFEETVIATILKQALQGLDYLHKHGHIHRDVKAGNLLVDEEGNVLLADFGVSSSLTEGGDKKSRKTFVGTPCWMAPEVMEGAEYDYKADIWSFGITSLELATGHAPFAKFPPLKVIMVTIQNEPPTLDRDATKHKYANSFKEMIDKCLQKDPTKRPTTEKLLAHAFFKQARKKDYLVTRILQSLPPLEERPHKRVQQKPIILEKGVTWDFGEYRETSDETPSSPEKRVAFSSSPEAGELTTSKEDQARKSRFLINQGVNTEADLSTLQSTVPQNQLSLPAEAVTDGLAQQDVVNEEQTQQRMHKKGRFLIGDKATSLSEIEGQNPNLTREQSNENIPDHRKSRFHFGDSKNNPKRKFFIDVEAKTDGFPPEVSQFSAVSHSTNSSPTASIIQDSSSMSSQIAKLIQQNETQGLLLNEIRTFMQHQQFYNYQKPPTLNGGAATKDLNDMLRENDELRKQNEELKGKVEHLEKRLRDLSPLNDSANASSENIETPNTAPPFSADTDGASNSF